MLINLGTFKGVFFPYFFCEKLVEGHHRRIHLPRGYSRGYLGEELLDLKKGEEKNKKNSICDRGIRGPP